MLKTLLVPALFAAFNISFVNGQNGHLPCGANELHRMGTLAPEDRIAIAAADAELEAFTAQWALDNTGAERVDYTIPVVFHIIHNNGPENISDEQVFDAVRVLNEDFNRENLDWQNVEPAFLDLVADIGITFVLAKKDPNGNCTKGITRTVSPLTNQGDQEMKELIQWPRNKYLNIWVAASADGAAGYTYRPGAVANWPEADGIVLLHNYTGAIGTSSPSRSRTLTHEVGHWINLKHTWGDSNEPGLQENCDDDDSVTDTPNTIGWTNCTLSGASCGSAQDNVENYMEYSYCSKMFTLGQKTRMLAAVNAGTAQRNQLVSASNLTATGVNDAPILCAAEFVSNATIICAGSSVNYSDVSFYGVTSRTWDFPGGTPSTSTEEDPVVVYNEPGTYSVTLNVSDGSANLSTTQNAVITVIANPGAAVPAVEGFETISALNGPEWYVNNPTGGNTFAITSTAAYTGAKSARLLNSTAMAGTTDELLSQTFDMSASTDIILTFRYAYAKRNSTSDDVLTVSVSNNCGESWSIRKIMRGSTNLTTGGVVTGNFIPNSSQWGYAEVTNISSTSAVSDFRFKFTFESDGGNNLYIDDININGGPVGVEELLAAGQGVTVVPNPAADEAQVIVAMDRTEATTVDVLDVTGRVIAAVHSATLAAGTHRFTLPIGQLQSGAYLVRVQQGATQRVSRFVVR
jgi:PKD repeat protein